MFAKKLLLTTLIGAALVATVAATADSTHDGSKCHPLRVMLVPADGGTEDGTKADFLPVFNAVTRTTGLNFDIKVGQSYGAVMEAICAKQTEIAFFGPASCIPVRMGAAPSCWRWRCIRRERVLLRPVRAPTPYKTAKDTRARVWPWAT